MSEPFEYSFPLLTHESSGEVFKEVIYLHLFYLFV